MGTDTGSGDMAHSRTLIDANVSGYPQPQLITKDSIMVQQQRNSRQFNKDG